MAYILHGSAHYCHIVTYIVTYACNVLYGLVSDSSLTLVDHISVTLFLFQYHLMNSWHGSC